MSNRKDYEMSGEELDSIVKACQPVPYMIVGGVPPRSPQENANAAWGSLGDKMGFDHMSVKPVPGKGMEFFSAIPKED